jgi:hypothetical protein
LDWDVGVETGQQCGTTAAKPKLDLFRFVQKMVLTPLPLWEKRSKVSNNSTLGLGMTGPPN